MTTPPNRRDDAIKAFQARQAREQQEATDRQCEEHQQIVLHQQMETTWRVTGTALISNAVVNVGNDFVNHGATLFFRQDPLSEGVCFEVHQSGQLTAIARLQFDLTGDGQVVATTNLSSAILPPPIAVGQLTAEWAAQAAEEVMVIALAGVPVPR